MSFVKSQSASANGVSCVAAVLASVGIQSAGVEALGGLALKACPHLSLVHLLDLDPVSASRACSIDGTRVFFFACGAQDGIDRKDAGCLS